MGAARAVSATRSVWERTGVTASWHPVRTAYRGLHRKAISLAHLLNNSAMKHHDRFILLSTHDLGGKMETRVTVRPGDKGTKKLVQEFGQKLLCVRYRYDPVRRMRHKTVELVVESARGGEPRRGRGQAPQHSLDW